jgi:hypothetical protein
MIRRKGNKDFMPFLDAAKRAEVGMELKSVGEQVKMRAMRTT